MFRNLFSKKVTRRSASARTNRFRAQYDALEDRLAMSLFGGVPGGIVHIPTPIVFLPPATAVNLTVEPRDVVTGSLGASETSQYYSFQLQQGDYLQSDVSVRATGTVACQMSILNSSGTVLDSSGPDTPYGFRAPASGTYYAEVTGSVSGLFALGSYQLELHRLALAQGTQSVATLAETGSMYAFLNGNTLDITGPTGYGFGITGNWTETTTTNFLTHQVAATYTATGTLELQSAAGSIALDIGAGQVAMVATAAQLNGQVFGVVSGLNIPVTMNTSPIVTTVASAFGYNLNALDENVTFDITIGGAAGIALGNNSVVQATQAPVDNAIPYLYFTINPLGTGITNVLSFVFDPADPALYLEGKALGLLPLGPVTLAGIGFSLQGQIPYTPVDAPSQDTSTMVSGNLVLQGSVDTTAITAIPSKVAGDIILNLDPNHTGKFLGGPNVTAAALALVFSPEYANVLAASDTPLVENLSQVFRNLTVGINGTLELNPFAIYQQDASWWVGNEILSLPTGTSSFLDQVLNWTNGKLGDPQLAAQLAVGDASLIYDGPSESFYFRGGTTDPFAGTPYLDTLTPMYTFLTDLGMLPTLDLDVAVRPGGEFYLDLTGTSNIAGLPDSSQLVLAHDYPVTGPATEYLSAASTTGSTGLPAPKLVHAPTLYTGVYIAANVSVLGNEVELQGTMAGNGDFTLQADAQVNLGPLTGSAEFTMSDTQAQGFSFTANVDASFSSSYIRGSIDASLTFGISGDAISYAGSVTASGQVYVPFFGWEGGSLSAGISNDEIWVSVDGYTVDILL